MSEGYSPTQLARALARIKNVAVPPQVADVTVTADSDGRCLVHIVEARREASLGYGVTVALTSEETRAWRAECRRVAGEGT